MLNTLIPFRHSKGFELFLARNKPRLLVYTENITKRGIVGSEKKSLGKIIIFMELWKK